jgi:hypothetical protein
MIIFNIIGILMIAFSAFLTYRYTFKREIIYKQFKNKNISKEQGDKLAKFWIVCFLALGIGLQFL